MYYIKFLRRCIALIFMEMHDFFACFSKDCTKNLVDLLEIFLELECIKGGFARPLHYLLLLSALINEG